MARVNTRFNFIAMATVAVVLLLMACSAPGDKQANPASQALASNGTSVATATLSPGATSTATYDAPPTALDNRNDPNAPYDLVTPITSDVIERFVTPSPIATSGMTATLAPVRPEDKISADLAKAMTDSPQDINFVIMLSEQPTSYSIGIDTSKMSDTQRRQYLADRDKTLADRTQPAVKAALDKLQKSGQVHSYASFTIFNGFQVEGTAEAVKEISSRTDVGSLDIVHTMSPWTI